MYIYINISEDKIMNVVANNLIYMQPGGEWPKGSKEL